MPCVCVATELCSETEQAIKCTDTVNQKCTNGRHSVDKDARYKR
jgi:hypothetical protein